MRIYFNGCSHTIGTPLSLPNHRDAFPYILGDMYNAEVVCEALMGGSNERIVRSTIEATTRSDFDLAIIQWTHLDRFESVGMPSHRIHSSRNRRGETDEFGFIQHRPESSTWISRAKEDIPYRNFYRHIMGTNDESRSRNIIRMHRKYLTQILGLDGYLKNMGIRTIHIPFQGYKMENSLSRRIESECELAAPLNIGLFGLLRNRGYDICKKSSSRDAKGEFDGHFEADGHKETAFHISKIIDNNNTEEMPIDYEIEEAVQGVYDWE